MSPVLEKGIPGAFEIIVDGRTIFSKKSEGRFPADQEVLDALPTP